MFFSCKIYIFEILLKEGRRSGAVFSTVASEKEGPQFNSWVRAFLCGACMFSLCLCGFSPGSLQVLRLPPTVQKHAKLGVKITGPSKLP